MQTLKSFCIVDDISMRFCREIDVRISIKSVTTSTIQVDYLDVTSNCT